MSYSLISTWRMSANGAKKAARLLQNGANSKEALISAVTDVEDNPNFTSVGFGGLPNQIGKVQLDAGFMDGNTLQIGAVSATNTVKKPIKVAVKLADEEYNNFLTGLGADQYAKEHGFEESDNLTQNAINKYEARLKEVAEKKIKPYDGHDTVGFVIQNETNHLVAGTSTSGLFMKKPGRVGDSPFPGSGYYAISGIGGAAATGMGEDIMKGSLPYQTVQNMAQGMSAQEAVQKAGETFTTLLSHRSNAKPREISLVALDAKGNFGVYTNTEFYFVIASDKIEVSAFHIIPQDNVKNLDGLTSTTSYKYEKLDLDTMDFED